ncbi:acetyl-CoA synthetase-like protein [Sistotremastrum niveocremeum HHB9708]|uniref:Acetyl-CoA synthetase-like protein n=1 Tax=Sistotremastrum niveocremeum HHB9708 TaxID=1314777 RepID=A0A164TAB3_9AGAM|nr:acetyl-CoA synthetase-like protein [Sistotremastrum niveocremeum HHB9708]
MVINSPHGPLPELPLANIHDTIFRRPGAPEIPDHVSQIDARTGEQRTRKAFIELIRDGATALSSSIDDGGLGLRGDKGRMVGILSFNSLNYIALVHSLFIIATPFVPLSAHSTSSELAFLLSKSGATHIFVESTLLPKMLGTIRDAGISDDRILLLDEPRASPNLGGIRSFDSLIKAICKRNIPRADVRSVGKDTLAYLMFSSGTSGLPKAVAVSHANVNTSLMQYLMLVVEAMKVMKLSAVPGEISKVLAALPFSHTAGLHVLVIRALLLPNTLVILPKWDVNMAIDCIQKYRISSLFIVPSMIHTLVHSERFAKADLSSLTGLGTGAAHFPPALGQRLLSKPGLGSSRLSIGYGLSEATVGAIYSPPEGILGGRIKDVPKDTTGILVPGMQARIVKEDGTDASVNEPGELWLKGPAVTMGYWNDEERTKETFLPDGWLRTGDRFRIDERGYFFSVFDSFEDRLKDTLKVSGLQVSPAEIEDVLISQPDGLIIDASVSGVSGSRTSDEKSPRAWVVLSKSGRKVGKEQVAAKLNAWVEENLSKYKWLRGGIEFVDEIPKNAAGKVLRRLLVDEYEKSRSGRAHL